MVQYADLDASTVRLQRRSSLSQSQKRALFAMLGAIGCVAVVVVMVGFTSVSGGSSNGAEVLLGGEEGAARMALRKGASEMRLREGRRSRGGGMLRHFDALQERIEKDLGINKQQQQPAAAAARTVFPSIKAQAAARVADKPRRMKMAMWDSALNGGQQQQQRNNIINNKKQQQRRTGLSDEYWDNNQGAEYEPESYSVGPYNTNDNYDEETEGARASATLSASKAQDALHRIEQLEKEANDIRNEMAARNQDVQGARQSIDNELGAIYDATQRAEESLDHSAAVQREAAKALDTAESIREEEQQRAARIAEIEERVEAEARYIDSLLQNVQNSGGYANDIAEEANYANHAVQAIHNYFEDSFTLTKAISDVGNEARGKLGDDLSQAQGAVNDLENESAYGANAAAMSQHYATAARQFAMQAAGAAKGAYNSVEGSLQAQEASVQAAFQAVQSAKGAKAAEDAASSAREGAEAAMRMARAALRHTYGFYGPQLPSDPVERAEYLVDRMLPILSRAADELDAAQGDCDRTGYIITTMRQDVQPISDSGDNMEMTDAQVKEVQTYADEALGSTLERLMVEMMQAVQTCGADIVGEGEDRNEAKPQEDNSDITEGPEVSGEDDTHENRENDGGLITGEQAPEQRSPEESLITAKQLVDSRVSVISAMLDKVDASLVEGDCAAIRQETEDARADFNYFETEEMRVLQGLEPADIETVDQYAQVRLMPLLQTSLDTFDRVKERCGREIFSDMPLPSSDNAASREDVANGSYDEQQEQQEQQEQPNPDLQQPEPTGAPRVNKPTTANIVSSKIVIDNMVRSINNLMDEVSKDATDCQAADNAGVAFKAKFAALEHIASKYESVMSDDEKAEVEQYAEDMMGSVMEQLFNVVMQVTANCGTKSFDLLGAHDVEDFYEDEARHTLAERSTQQQQQQQDTDDSSSSPAGHHLEQPYDDQEPRGPYNEPLPSGEPNPDAEETVAEMKQRVLELKKRLDDLRSAADSGSDSGSASGSESGSASGGSAASSGSGSESAAAAASGSASAASGSAAAASGSASGSASAASGSAAASASAK